MSIVHMDEIWVEIAKNFEMRTSGGEGGSTVISDTPGRGGGGGVKKGQIFADVLYGWPLRHLISRVDHPVKPVYRPLPASRIRDMLEL